MNPFLPTDIQSDLVLASASPRRREILERLGFEFEVIPAGLEEEQTLSGDPESNVKLLAELKGVEVQGVRPRKTIIAADTIVRSGDVTLGKPRDPAEAFEMLRALRGRVHSVITGVAIIAPPNRRIIEAESTNVYFRDISDQEIHGYIDTSEPFGKAGAYAIQGFASAFVDRIEGCYFNVVGLPVALLFRMFRQLERAGRGSRGTA
jgi:septum formation protein